MASGRRKCYYDDIAHRAEKITAGIGVTAKSTTYAYAPFDRTVSRTVDSKTTMFRI